MKVIPKTGDPIDYQTDDMEAALAEFQSSKPGIEVEQVGPHSAFGSCGECGLQIIQTEGLCPRCENARLMKLPPEPDRFEGSTRALVDETDQQSASMLTNNDIRSLQQRLRETYTARVPEADAEEISTLRELVEETPLGAIERHTQRPEGDYDPETAAVYTWQIDVEEENRRRERVRWDRPLTQVRNWVATIWPILHANMLMVAGKFLEHPMRHARGFCTNLLAALARCPGMHREWSDEFRAEFLGALDLDGVWDQWNQFHDNVNGSIEEDSRPWMHFCRMLLRNSPDFYEEDFEAFTFPLLRRLAEYSFGLQQGLRYTAIRDDFNPATRRPYTEEELREAPPDPSFRGDYQWINMEGESASPPEGAEVEGLFRGELATPDEPQDSGGISGLGYTIRHVPYEVEPDGPQDERAPEETQEG